MSKGCWQESGVPWYSAKRRTTPGAETTYHKSVVLAFGEYHGTQLFFLEP